MKETAEDLAKRLSKADLFQNKQKDRHYLYHGKPSKLPENAQGYRVLRAYLDRRQQIVGQILLTAEKLREKTSLTIKTIEATGAFWQYFKGIESMPACHTSPCLILFNGHLPHIFTDNMALREKIIMNFADVMLMPDYINRVDSFVDERIGSKDAMVEAMRMMIIDVADYRKALEHYRQVRSENLQDFLSGFSPITSRQVTVFDSAAGRYTQAEANVIDDDLTELRLIFREYIESDRASPNYKALENYRLELGGLEMRIKK